MDKYRANFIDPRELPLNNKLIVVLCDDRSGAVGSVIKVHSGGNYNHGMTMSKKGMVASQAGTFKEFSVERYMKPGILMKFWEISGISDEETAAIKEDIEKDLKKPWWMTLYDVPGILGQAVWLRWIQIPGLYYCSERVAKNCRKARSLSWFGTRPNPSDLDKLFNEHPGHMKLLGYWLSD